MSRTLDKIRNYWTIVPPVYLKHPKHFNGVCITPEHQTKQVLMPRYEDDVISITPIHEPVKTGSIKRTFGDLLADEVA